MRLRARKALTQSPVQLGITGFPNLVTDMNAPEVDVAAAELKHRLAATFADLVHAAAFFLLIRMACVKYEAVAGLERRFQLQHDALALDPLHFAQVNAALFSEPRVH